MSAGTGGPSRRDLEEMQWWELAIAAIPLITAILI